MKIKYEQAHYILGYKKRHIFKQLFCTWKIEAHADKDGFFLYCKIKMLIYILAYLPLHILLFIACILDGGITQFFEDIIANREVDSYHFFKDEAFYKRARDIGVLR